MKSDTVFWYNKLSTRFFLCVMIGIILPISAVLLWVNQSYEQYIRTKLNEQVVSTLSQSESEIYAQFSRMVNISSIICNDSHLQQILQHTDSSRYERTLCFDSLVHTIEINNLYDMDNVRLTCFDSDGNVYANWSTNYHNYTSLFQQEWVQKSLTPGSYIQWNMFAPSFILEEGNSTQYISLARGILQTSGGQNVGTVIVSIKQESLSQTLSRFLNNPGDAVYICTDEGHVVLSQGGTNGISEENIQKIYNQDCTDGNASKIISTQGKTFLLSYYTLSNQFTFDGHKLKVLYLLQYDLILHDMIRLAGKVLTVLLCSLFVVICIAFVITQTLLRPVEVLSNEMVKYRPGVAITDLDMQRKDEIGQINHAFSRMGDTITQLFEEQRKETEVRERYRYEALRAQVNPHFLFNTLNTIRWMAIIRKADNIVDCIDALSTMLKYSMSRGGEMAKLKEEIEIIQSYIYISNCRYGNRLNLEVDLDDAVQQLYVVKFILQPIVENSVIHGFKGTEKSGTVLIYGDIEENQLKLYIEDDGQGLSALNEEQPSRPRGKITGIGINNVNDRIKSTYGPSYGVRVYNGAAGGTVAEFVLPVIKEIIENAQSFDS